MSKKVLAVAAVSACALGAGAWAWRRRRKAGADVPALPPAVVKAAVEVAVPPVPVESRPSVQPPKVVVPVEKKPGGGKLPMPSLSTIKTGLGGGALTPLATVTLGVKMLNGMGDVATAVGGQGAGDVARAGIGGLGVGVGVIVGKGTEALAQKVGVSAGVAKTLGQVAGAGAALGPVGIVVGAQVKAVGEGAKWAVGKVLGKEAAQQVSNVTRKFDPFLKGSLTNKPVAAVSKGVKAVGKVLGKIF